MMSPKTQSICHTLSLKPHISILFVCLGNICRSPAAQGIMQAIVDEEGDATRWTIDSAGTGNYHIGELPDSRMRAHARRRGLDLTHRCRQISTDDFDRFDLIVAMDASNVQNLRRLAPSVEALDKIVAAGEFFDGIASRYDYVPDPYYEGSEGFELVLDLLTNACHNLYNSLSH